MARVSILNIMNSMVPISRFNKGEASKIFDEVELALELIKMLEEKYPTAVEDRFKGAKTLEEIAEKRGYKLKEGEPDIERTASAVIDDFRKGRMGRITLD